MNINGLNTHIINASTLFQRERAEFDLKVAVQTPTSSLESLQERVGQINTQILSEKGLQDYQTLCGRIHQLEINRSVDEIFDEAAALKQGRYHSDEERLERIEGLKGALGELWSSYTAFSKENSDLIRAANGVVSELSTSPISSVAAPLKRGSLATEEEAIELMVIAQKLYEGKEQEALRAFRQLPQSVQKDFGGVEMLSFERAVIYAYDATRNDGYTPSREEIESILEEGSSYA